MSNYVPIELSYKIFESKDGCDTKLSPVIFIHGITAAKEVWDDIPQIIADKTKRKTFSYDARNHGDSEYTENFSFDLNVKDLFHFMDSMDIQRAILIGHSMGGLTATNASLQKPERVEKVFSEDMFVNRIPKAMLAAAFPLIQLRNASMKHIPKGYSEEEAIQFSTEFICSNMPEDSPFLKVVSKEELAKSKVFLRRSPDGEYSLKLNIDSVFRAIGNSETLMTEPEGQYEGPAYFIFASQSFVNVKAHAENIMKHFPKAELIEFDSANHNLHIELPDKFINALLARLI